jgi:ketosteroid isomerase-like protein
MSQENVEIVLRVMQRFADQDLDAALEDVDAEATLDWSNSDALDSGVYTGRAAWRAFMQERDAALGERRVDTVEILAATTDTVVLAGRIREQGRVSGVAVETRGATVWTLRDGKVIRLKIYQSTDEALKAVGLKE